MAQTDSVFVGKTNFETIQKNYPWFNQNLTDYKPNYALIEELKKVKKPYQVIIVGGDWCSDTQEQLPKFYVGFAELDYSKAVATAIYFVSKDKKLPADIVAKYKIERIPTFIVFDEKENEVGRIVETPSVSLESDLLQILLKIK